MQFSDTEIEILQCFAKAWGDSDNHPLYGNISYQMAMDLMRKLGVDPKVVEDHLVELQEGADLIRELIEIEERINSRIAES